MKDLVNILLVDDDTRNLDVLESVLACPDYRLFRARTADEALLALIDNPGVIAQALAAARMIAADSELLRFARSAEAQRLFPSC